MARLVLLGCLAYLVVGLGQLVVGTVMEPMVNAYGVQYGDGGQLVMHQFLGSMTGVLLAPLLLRRLGKKPLLLLGFSALATVELIYFLHPSWSFMLTVAPIAGFGFGTIEAVVGAFIIGTAAGSANVAMSRIELFFGIGAALMPFIGAAFIAGGYWNAPFALVSILAVTACLVWAVWWPRVLDAPEGYAADKGKQIPRAARLTSLNVLVAGALFFLVYVGFEMSFLHYLPSLLVQDHGLTDAVASLSLSIFWGAMVIGRLVSGQMADRWGGGVYLLVTCGVALVCFVLLDGIIPTMAGIYLLVFAAGLAMSGMFSVALVFVNRAVPGMTEKATSLMMAAGGIGGALMPRLTGGLIDGRGTDAAWQLFIGYAVLMLAVAIWAIWGARINQRRLGPSVEVIARLDA